MLSSEIGLFHKTHFFYTDISLIFAFEVHLKWTRLGQIEGHFLYFLPSYDDCNFDNSRLFRNILLQKREDVLIRTYKLRHIPLKTLLVQDLGNKLVIERAERER